MKGLKRTQCLRLIMWSIFKRWKYKRFIELTEGMGMSPHFAMINLK